MSKPKLHLLSSSLFVIILTCLVMGCDNDDESSGDFYPLAPRTELYKRYIFHPLNNEYDPWDTIALSVRGDSLVQGRSYAVLSYSNGMKRLVRAQGPQYYARNVLPSSDIVGDEFMFLDTRLPVGASWTSTDKVMGRTMKFTVIEKNFTTVLYDTKFEDVIVIEERYSRSPDESFVGYKYYQKGVGEILAQLPSPYSYTYGDTKHLIIQ